MIMDYLCLLIEGKESRLKSRFMTRATERMQMPLTNMERLRRSN